MRSLLTIFIPYLIVAAIFSNLFAQSPPKGLKWGMTYDQVKAHLITLPKNKTSKVGKLLKVEQKSSKKRSWVEVLSGSVLIIDNISSAEFKKNLKIAKQKIHDSYLYFHPKNGLCSVWFQRRFHEEDEKANNLAWSYFKTVQTLLATKYGEPNESVDLKTPHIRVLPESPFRSKWIFPEKDAVILLTLSKVKQIFYHILPSKFNISQMITMNL